MIVSLFIAACVIITFIIPMVQLFIGFKYIVQNEDNPKQQCKAALNLPSLMIIFGIFALFFLSTAYGFLKIISSVSKYQSDVSQKMLKILVGLASFIFGTITLIFFILIQIRVYGHYLKGVQFNNNSVSSYCQSTVMRDALIMIILTYINMSLFVGILVFTIVNTRNKLEEEKPANIETAMANVNYRFYEVTQRQE
ncbi:unnamed protein product [Rotaria sp. Silwood1]|nr:unnamed protein product [Rotaria sp. Silwood1]CAF3648374.1 unnamed protein product [Rotaria sp. Silwood1]CAF4945433.1 unnamed protein product [Rotaria sp. Silwood1]CAF5092165.1 unnamed protein product [Rotaria sp. Silwood1]